jgi:hypothetical protein
MRRRNADGTWRWYQEYDVPPEVGGGTIMVRLDTTEDDRKRRFKRTEHVRPIPPGDPDYQPLYGRRADIESINRGLDDTLYLTRARSDRHQRSHDRTRPRSAPHRRVCLGVWCRPRRT